LDLGSILLLAALSLGMHIWLIRHTEVAARDSIGFIRYAWQLEHQPWVDVVRQNHQHPGYPLVLLAVSRPVRHFVGGTAPEIFQLSAQLASALAGMLLVVPMYVMGSLLANRKTGFWGALLFQSLPIGSRLMADGLSEATFLFFGASALLFGVMAFQKPSTLRYALCGLFGAFAYLTRPEGALIVLGAALVWFGIQAFRALRLPWGHWLAHGTVMATVGLLVAGPYCWAIGGITNKPTAHLMFKRTDPPGAPALESSHNDAEVSRAFPFPPTDRPTAASMASLFSVFAPATPHNPGLWAIRAIATEISRGFEHFAVIPFLLGLWLSCRWLRRSAVAWFLLAFALLQTATLWKLAQTIGYISDRHVVLVVLCGVFAVVTAMPLIARWLLQLVALTRSRRPHTASYLDRWQAWATAGLLVTLVLSGLPETLKPMHANRIGHKQAGLWLAGQATSEDVVVDPFCWAHYYSGKLFEEGTKPALLPDHEPTLYVVMEKGEHLRLPLMTEAKKLAEQGAIVYHWPEQATMDRAKIFIYSVPANQ
jgi:hypothetical protein